jgi:hypothetical protein
VILAPAYATGLGVVRRALIPVLEAAPDTDIMGRGFFALCIYLGLIALG